MMRIYLLPALLLLFSGITIAQDIDFEHFEQIKARNIGPAGMSGRVTAIDVNLSRPDHIYVGTASGGVWKSENGGISWEPIFDDVPTLSIGAIKINQSNPLEIWVGTGEGNPRNSQNSGAGVYRSMDGGRTWDFMGLKDSRVIHRIVIDESRPGTVYIGAQGAAWGESEERGVFKTTNGGKNWDKILFINNSTGVADMVMDPFNPNKIVVAMWEFGRKPWTFNSGGEGSGLHITYDGGTTWKRITDKEGFPKGNLGRMGIAIARSNPDIIYALVEAKENALYKSEDGGATWKKHSTHENIGNRPFYYSEIYVDPLNELRVYSLYTYISRSEDGGKTFEIIADYGNDVHPDHHAFWINPTDPSHLINGNDGGMNISYDNGDTWRFVNNLPVGQFYHVNVDDDFPYNVYGGMQDNGSWVGPAFTLKSGGITNHDWQEVYFGDGFDVAPKPDNNRYVYAMSQGGNIGLVDRETGQNKFVKPLYADSVKLRFNWNAPMALEPDSDCGLYYGSQFVHYSDDCGQSWAVISPDLTTNDTSKQRQDISGGLTIDATNAENNTTLIAIAPSPVDKKVIWAGSDDGRLHITKDGGESWQDVYSKLPGAPKAGWIPQIQVNDDNSGEAWVVINNYRQNDWSAYLYHTNDYGSSWTRVVDDRDVTSFVTSVKQDKEEPNLLFLGTDAGLYISFDKGGAWHKWDEEFPSVQIRDITIQETFDDLVLGTFGRAFWVIDDIGVFREMAKNDFTKSEFDVVSVTDGYLSQRRSYQGIRFVGQAEFVGDNKGTNAMFSIWVDPSEKKTDNAGDAKDEDGEKEDKEKNEKVDKSKLKFIVLNQVGDTVRTFSRKIKDKGLIRTTWSLETDGVAGPSRREREEDADPPYGILALPGTYEVHVIYGDLKDSITVEVKTDPRIEMTDADRQAMVNAREKIDALMTRANDGFEKIRDAKESLAVVEKLVGTLTDTTKTNMGKLMKEHKKKLGQLEDLFFNKRGLKGIQRNPEVLNSYLGSARRYFAVAYGAPGPNAEVAFQKAVEKTDKVLAELEAYFAGDWKDFQQKVEATDFSIFK